MRKRGSSNIFTFNKNDRKRQRRMEMKYGRHWKAAAQNQRSADQASGGTGGITPVRTALPPASWRTINDPFRPGGVTHVDPSLMALASKAMQDLIDQQVISTVLYGNSITTFRGIPVHELLRPAKPELKREMVVGEIIGYRCWRLEPNGVLRSTYQNDRWLPKQILTGRELGDWDSRGVHAWKEPNSKPFNDYVRGFMDTSRDPWFRVDNEARDIIVTGSIYLWGDVVEHEYGYRGEYASVRSLDWLYPDARLMGRERETLFDLRERYGVNAAVPYAK